MPRGVALSLALLALLLQGALPVGAHGDEAEDEPARAEEEPEHHRVDIRDLRFEPRTLHVRAGEHVAFTNHDTDQLHALVSNGSSLNSEPIFPHQSFEWAAPAPGNYSYSCKYIPEMKGTVVVGPPPPPNQPPVVNITSPSNGAKVEGIVRVTGTADDPDLDPFLVRVRIDGGAWRLVDAGWNWSFSWNSSRASTGRHVIEAQSEDLKGLASHVAAVTVEVENPRDEAGDLAAVITAPGRGAKVSGDVLVQGVVLTEDEADVAVQVRIDRGPWLPAEGGKRWSFAWDTLGVRDGTRRIQAIATTASRTSLVEEVEVVVENAARTRSSVTILTPQERESVAGIVEIRGQAHAPDSDRPTVLVRVDEGRWQLAEGTTRWSFEWDSTTVANGPHLIQVVVRDDTMSSVAARVTVVTENEAPTDRPTVRVFGPTDGQRLSGIALVQGRAATAVGSLAAVEVKVDEGPWETASGTARWAFTLNTTSLANGPHRITVRSLDARSPSDNVTVDVVVENLPRAETPVEYLRSNRDVEPPPITPEAPKEAPSPSGLAALVAAAALARGATRRRG